MMLYHNTQQLQSSQKSVHFFREEVENNKHRTRDGSDRYAELYPHMLIEDVSLKIMPIGGHTENSDFRVEWSPTDSEVETAIVQALSRDRRGVLSEVVCDFFHDCAQTLMTYGRAVYEIVLLSSPESGHLVSFRLVQINPDSLTVKRDNIIQSIPKSVAVSRQINEQVSIPPDTIQLFLLPESLRNIFKALMEKLSFLSSPGPTELMFPENTSTQEVPYNYTKHMNMRDIAILDAVKEIGWNARRQPEKDVLEYYWLERYLRFEEFLVNLRSCILANLNEAVLKAGRKMGFSGVVAIEGLPTLDDVKESRRRLSVGDGRFDEILKPFARV
jgi:hypothetical protein